MRFIIILLCFATNLAQGQLKDLNGSITDYHTGEALQGVLISNLNSELTAISDSLGRFQIKASNGDQLLFKYLSYETQKITVKDTNEPIHIALKTAQEELDEVAISEQVIMTKGQRSNTPVQYLSVVPPPHPSFAPSVNYHSNTESYARIDDNDFLQTTYKPLSTFSADVDKASYSNMRRMINQGQTIPKDAIRTEELINYFSYTYPPANGKDPISITTHLSEAPWNKAHQLLQIGIQGKVVDLKKAPASNLVFLIDVSGSMFAQNKLPLLQSALKIVVEQLRKEDRVSIVTYAGTTKVVLEPTSGSDKQAILNALDGLRASGSTAGSDGLKLAYKTAKEHFLKKGNNRILLATDGDFNVGPYSDSDMEALIVKERNAGIFLSCLGVGMGNYKDSKMELLADKGDGTYAYIDNMQEAQRVLGTEFAGSIFTIAKDVKIQVEFNPALVQAYRLIGYENRLLADEDFKDDQKDAGDMGSGHSVTALYEIIPAGIESAFIKPIDSLKYQAPKAKSATKEMAQLRFRYKKPTDSSSEELIKVVQNKMDQPTTDSNFAAAVAMWGMYLRNNPYLNKATKQDIIDLATANKGTDLEGYRAEFIRLMKSYHKTENLE